MKTLTKHDADVMASLLFTATRLAERAVEVIELYHEQAYMTTSDYKALVKKVGMVEARQVVHDTNKRVMRNDDKCRLNQWLDAANKLHIATERLTIASMDRNNLNDPTISAATMFDWIQEGAAILGRLFITFGNVSEEDIVKVESYAKILQKNKITDLALLEYFNPKL